jgi:hypothetical protein
VANLTEIAVLCSDPKPLVAKAFCELTGFWGMIWGFCCDGAGEYPGRTRW